MNEYPQIMCTCGKPLNIKLDAPWDAARIIEVEPCERCVSKAQNTYLCGHELGDRSYCQICE